MTAPSFTRIFLGAGVIILEGLNLASVRAGTYELICLPLKLVGAEGAPARAVLTHRFKKTQWEVRG
jgi:arylformamidase